MRGSRGSAPALIERGNKRDGSQRETLVVAGAPLAAEHLPTPSTEEPHPCRVDPPQVRNFSDQNWGISVIAVTLVKPGWGIRVIAGAPPRPSLTVRPSPVQSMRRRGRQNVATNDPLVRLCHTHLLP